MTTDRPVPEFAREFAHVVVAAHDELCGARERAEPGEMIAVAKRADAPQAGLHAILVLGNKESIDRFMKEHDLD